MDAGAGEVESLEQQQALALARARQRMQAAGGASEEEGSGVRGANLAARAVYPEVAGATAGAGLGALMGGVGAVPGAMAGLGAVQVLRLVDSLFGKDYLGKVMDKMGLPRPEGDDERLWSKALESAAGAIGVGGLARTVAASASRPTVKAVAGQMGSLLDRPVMGAAAAASGGAAQEAVRQEPPGIVPPELGGNQTEQLLANIAGSVAVPVAGDLLAPVGRAVARKVGDVGHAVGAAMGRPESVKRLAGDALETLVKDDKAEIVQALRGATEYVPGAKPTVAEAIAEANLKQPTRQVGGALVRLQDEISGHRGAEDILPSKMKANQAAVDTYTENLGRQTGMLRDQAFRNARTGQPGLAANYPPGLGADPLQVARVVNYALQDREIAGHALARRALGAVLQDLKKVPRLPNGRLDPEILQGIRQSAGVRMAGLLKDNPTANQAVAAKALSRVHAAIDDAIEAGGATGWKTYMRMHAQGMKPVDAHVERLAEANRISQGIQATGPEGAVREVMPNIPTLLHRPTMFANFVLGLITKDATSPVVRRIATDLQDPEKFAQLLARPQGSAARKVVDDVLIRAAILSNAIRTHQGEQAGGNPER